MKAIIFAISITCCTYLQGAGSSPSFTMRIDDNHSVDDWRRVAGIFESRGMRCSFAVVPSGLSEEQGLCLKELAVRGHVIMDHTPNHTFYRATYHDRAAFESAKIRPFVAEVDEPRMTLYFHCEADEAHPKNRRLRMHIAKNIVTFDSPKSVRGMYDFIRIPGDSTIYGLQKDKKTGVFELRDFWRRPLARTIDLKEVVALSFDEAALQPCDDVLRELAVVSRERFDHFGLPRPTIWVRPGGWDPGVSCERLERIYGREFGYVGADSIIGAKRGSSRWTTGYDKMYFFDQGPQITPEQLVDEIQRNLESGRFHVTLSHMWCRDLPGGMEEWFAKTERFVQLLVDRKIPVMTMAESVAARFGASEINPGCEGASASAATADR